MDSHITADTKKKNQFLKAKGDMKKLKAAENEQAEKDTDDILKAGQDNTKQARREIDRIEQRDLKEEQKARDDAMNALDMKKKFRASYKTELAKNLSEMLTMLDWIRGWVADVVVTNGSPITIYGKPFNTQDGILLVVKTAKGNIMHKGMLVTGEPALDYAGLYNITLQVENTMDKARGLLLSDAPTNGDASGILDAHGQSIPTTKPVAGA